MGVSESDSLAQLSLPPGFRFYPTDEELLVQYLCRKVAGHHFSLQIIADIDLYKFDPWVLPSKAIFGEKEWYFFSPRDRKYPNGSRPNRVAGSGYWKATGTDKIITTEGRKVGIKKALVFYVGKAPKGAKTNWIMHEYRLLETPRKTRSSKLDDWVLCRIYKKNSSSQKPMSEVSNKEHSKNGSLTSSSSQLDGMLQSSPEIDDRLFALPSLAELSSVPELVPSEQIQTHNQVVPGYGNNGMYVPQFCNAQDVVANSMEGEVQSWNRTPREPVQNNSDFFQRNWGVLNQSLSNSVDPFGFKYPTQSGGFGFRQ